MADAVRKKDECPNITFKNSRYIISGAHIVLVYYWLWAREAGQNQGGDLVSIETEDEWNFINDQIQRRNTTYYKNKWSIGLTKKAGNWTWVNGRPLTICKWEQGEPRGEHDAAFMYKRSSNGEQGVFGGFNVIIMAYQHAYICEISEGWSSRRWPGKVVKSTLRNKGDFWGNLSA
ncbi:CD209 antigen-like protein A [Pocillopora verrucosa]|uniref:CD209 antigen-like protein A n=1 Tax=Pocillopora verrucosa TaxID=203993 RepID=UPI0033413BE5